MVTAASYEARKFGFHSAMYMRLAKQLCPKAIYIRGNGSLYGEDIAGGYKYSDARFTYCVEKASVDEFFAYLTGMD